VKMCETRRVDLYYGISKNEYPMERTLEIILIALAEQYT